MRTKNTKLRLRIIERFGTQEAFAVEAGIHFSTISRIVRNIIPPTEDQKQKICKLLGATPDEFFASKA